MREVDPKEKLLDEFSLPLFSRDPRMLKCHEHFTTVLDQIALRHSKVIFQVFIVRPSLRCFPLNHFQFKCMWAGREKKTFCLKSPWI